MNTWRASIDPEQILRHGPWLRGLARALVRDDAAADDLAQEAWLAAGAREDLDAARLRPFLAGVLRKLASTWRRGERRRADRHDALTPREGPPTPERVALELELQASLLAELRALAEPQRSTLVMRFYEGLSSAEIARRTAVPEATVRSRLARGLAALRAQLERRGASEGHDWRAALAPLAAAATWEAPRSGIGLAAASVAACLVIGVGAVVWRAASRADSAANEVPGAATAFVDEGAGAVDDERSVIALTQRESVPRVDRAAVEAQAAVDESVRIELRAVDELGEPLAGVQLDLHYVKLDEHPVSGADGVIALELEAETARELAKMHEAVLVLSRIGWRTERIGRKLALGKPLRLGDVTLVRCGSLEGLVLDATGAPVRLARVCATQEAVPERYDPAIGPKRSMYWASPAVSTDEHGRFEFPELVGGRWNVWASSPRHPWTHLDAVAVRGGRATSVEIRLGPEDRSHVVAGTLLDENGEPARGIVRLIAPDVEFDSEREDWASFDGRFELRVTEPWSEWTLVAEAFEAHKGRVERAVRAGDVDLQVRLETGAMLDVRVVDASGAPIGGASVHALDERGDPLQPSWARTSDDGGARVRWPAAAVALSASAPRHSQRVVPVATLAETLVVELERGPGLTGRVVSGGDPVANARIAMQRAADDGRFVACDENGAKLGVVQRVADTPASVADSDAEGEFALAVPRALREHGRLSWYLLASAPGFAPARVGPLELGGDVELDGVMIELSAGGAVRGELRSRAGESLAGWSVLVANGFGEWRELAIGENGDFEAEHLSPGRWQARAVRVGATRRLAWRWEDEPFEAQWSFDAVEGRVAQCIVELETLEKARLDGAVHFRQTPVGVWSVRLSRVDGRGGVMESTLDADGRFHFVVHALGRHQLELTSVDARWGKAWRVEELEIGERGVAWTCELDFAAVRGRSASGAERLRFVRSDPGGARTGCEFELDSNGAFHGRWAPTGRVSATPDGRHDARSELRIVSGVVNDLVAP